MRTEGLPNPLQSLYLSFVFLDSFCPTPFSQSFALSTQHPNSKDREDCTETVTTSQHGSLRASNLPGAGLRARPGSVQEAECLGHYV